MDLHRKSAVGNFAPVLDTNCAPIGIPLNISDAEEYWLNFGFYVLPAEITSKAKKPLVKFANQRNVITTDLCRYWLKESRNHTALMALTDNGLFILDADSPQSIEAVYAIENKFNIKSLFTVKTKNGMHFYYRLADGVIAKSWGYSTQSNPLNIDIRTGKSLIVLPPSLRDGNVAYHVVKKTVGNISQLSEVTQEFVNYVLTHNGEELQQSANIPLDNVSRWNGSELEIKEAKELLSFIEPDLSYENWLNVIFGITSKFGKTQEAITLIDNWSSKGSSYEGLDEIVYKVETLDVDGSITYATVCEYAKNGGADLKAIHAKYNSGEPSISTFNDAVDLLKVNITDKEAYDAAIFYISNAHSLDASAMLIQLKLVTNIAIGDIKRDVKEAKRIVPLTHDQIALQFISDLNLIKPVGSYGKIHSYDDGSGIWDNIELSKIGVSIASTFQEQALCKKSNDYSSIAKHIYDITEDKHFFSDAPKGVYTELGFHCVQYKNILTLPASPDYRARFRLDISPDADCLIPEFTSLLKAAFGSTYEEQSRQLREFIGLALFGVQSEVQMACLLIGKGGSGKSTILKILQHLVPKDFVAQISPTEMDSDYKRAALAGKLINIVPEINKDKPIPSAEFKSIIGGDTINAREPFGKVFSFVPEAGSWFNGNFYPVTRDHSDGFYRRWAIFSFMHGRSEQERDPNLLNRIVKNELPGILSWAFEGLKDYLNNGLFLSQTHYACLAEWKRDSNSVLSWLHDDDKIKERVSGTSILPLQATIAYMFYNNWCVSNNRKPFNKKQFYSFMEEAGHIRSGNNGMQGFSKLTS